MTTTLLLGAGCGGEPGNPAEAGGGVDPLEEGRSGATRPPTVPDDFVATPHGYFHPSCVVEVGDDETVGGDGALLKADGTARKIGGCQHARYDKQGRVIARGAEANGAVPAAVVNGWVASVSSTSVGPVQATSARWRVPAAPASARGQTLYLFPGLEPSATGAFILQPVLAWNGFADRRWTIASWNCCKDGTVLHSAPRNVVPGDTITGSVTGGSCDAQGVCATWSVRATSSRGAWTTLVTSAYGAALDWHFGGALEAFGVDACSQYPRDGRVTFDSIVVRRIGGAAVTPSWVPMSYAVSPDCLTSVAAAPGGASVTMTWRTR
jgi:hypothetical protein